MRTRHGNQSLRGALAMAGFLAAMAVCFYLALVDHARAHSWFPASCCNGGDCRVITADQVQTTKQGFVFPGNPEVVPYSSPKIRQTPPEGDNAYAICTRGGVLEAPIICLYIPTWGS